MTNLEFKQDELQLITIDLIEKVMKQSLDRGHNITAALGCSGDKFILYGEHRMREISLTLHSGDVKLLVTDNCGSFLFYGGFDPILLPVKFIAKQYFEIIQNVKYLLDNTDCKCNVTEEDKEEMFKSRMILDKMLHCGFI